MLRRAIALAAGVFGLVTIVAGTRVLTGADPGHVVFRPLLIFNTIMGFVYVLAAVQIWRDDRQDAGLDRGQTGPEEHTMSDAHRAPAGAPDPADWDPRAAELDRG